MKHRVVHINQEDHYQASFNVLVPLDIQGKECTVLSEGQPATLNRGTTSTYILVDGKRYGVPRWAVEEVKEVPPYIPEFSI